MAYTESAEHAPTLVTTFVCLDATRCQNIVLWACLSNSPPPPLPSLPQSPKALNWDPSFDSMPVALKEHGSLASASSLAFLMHKGEGGSSTYASRYFRFLSVCEREGETGREG